MSLGIATKEGTNLGRKSHGICAPKDTNRFEERFSKASKFCVHWNKFGTWNLLSRYRMMNFRIYLLHTSLWYLSTLKLLPTLLDIPMGEEMVLFLFYW